MIIKNVEVFREDGTFESGYIVIKDGKIASVESGEVSIEEVSTDEGHEVIDGQGGYAIPGLVDIHFHGCMGHDFCDGTKEAIEEIGRYEASIGVTTIVPATLTLTTDELEAVLRNAAEFNKTMAKSPMRADLVGVNMEGPFISIEKKGAQDARNITPINYEVFHRFQAAAEGLVTFMGIAPERDGAVEFIEQVKDEAQVSIAHTNASYAAAKAAFDAGATHAVHLYNAMPAYSHREPGVVGAVFDSEHVHAELICDGVHIHPAVVRNTLRILGDDRVDFISDSMCATGMPDGDYTLGGLDVVVSGNSARLKSNGALAGSSTNLMDCVRVAVKEMDVPLGVAVKCASVNPAKHAKVYEQYGSISQGKRGNVVLLDKDLNLNAVIKDGVKIV